MISFNKVHMKKIPEPSPRLRPAKYLAVFITMVLTIIFADTGWSADSGAPVAQVNGVTIYQSDLSCAIEASLARNLASQHRQTEDPGSNSDQVNNKKTLNRLVDIELLYQESLKHRFRGLIEESERRYQLEVKRFGGEDKLISTLECNEMSSEQFRKAIFRNQSIKRLLDKLVYSSIQVTADEIREYYELNKDKFRKPSSVRVRQILIRVPSEPGDNKWRRAEERAHMIYRDASEGADFVRLARRHSDDPVSASSGGDIGSIQKGNQPSVFNTVIFSLKAGAVTKPIRSHQGFHIIKIVSTTSSTMKTIEEVKPYITTLTRRKKAREMISRLISDLKDKAEIKIIMGSNR
jgi:parvulin-like peptidyl-prolyl isomerase